MSSRANNARHEPPLFSRRIASRVSETPRRRPRASSSSSSFCNFQNSARAHLERLHRRRRRRRRAAALRRDTASKRVASLDARVDERDARLGAHRVASTSGDDSPRIASHLRRRVCALIWVFFVFTTRARAMSIERLGRVGRAREDAGRADGRGRGRGRGRAVFRSLDRSFGASFGLRRPSEGRKTPETTRAPWRVEIKKRRITR